MEELIKRLARNGYTQEQAEKLYAFYERHDMLDELEFYVVLLESPREL